MNARPHIPNWSALLVIACGFLSGCSSTSINNSAPVSSTIQSTTQAVALLSSLNSLRIDLAGNISGDLSPCFPDETGFRRATFNQLIFVGDLPDGVQEFKKSKLLTGWERRGKSPISEPLLGPAFQMAKQKLEAEHEAEMRSAVFEQYALTNRQVYVRYADETRIPIFAAGPVTKGDYVLRFAEVTRIKLESYLQGRGRVKFYNASGSHLGSLSFQDEDFRRVNDIQAALLLLCPKVH